MYSETELKTINAYLNGKIDKYRAEMHLGYKTLTNKQFDGIVAKIKDCLFLQKEIDPPHETSDKH